MVHDCWDVVGVEVNEKERVPNSSGVRDRIRI